MSEHKTARQNAINLWCRLILGFFIFAFWRIECVILLCKQTWHWKPITDCLEITKKKKFRLTFYVLKKDTYIWSRSYRTFKLRLMPISSMSEIDVISGTPFSGVEPSRPVKRKEMSKLIIFNNKFYFVVTILSQLCKIYTQFNHVKRTFIHFFSLIPFSGNGTKKNQ